MEESIWLYVGIIMSLFGMVIVASIIVQGQEQAKDQDAKNAIKKLEQTCNFVCNSVEETLITEKIRLPSGSTLTAKKTDNKLCINYKESNSCAKCSCSPFDYDLNLNTQGHLQAFSVNTFECTFHRVQGGVKIECKG